MDRTVRKIRIGARRLPVVRQVDLAVAGGSVAAIAAAVEVARAGKRVFLAAPRPFLGESLCSTLRLWRDTPPTSEQPLLQRIFGDRTATTPLRVKKVLEDELREAGVDFVLGCQAVGLLQDRDNTAAGLVVADRRGRQAIAAATVIDATANHLLAPHGPMPQPITATRVVLGGRDTSTAKPVRSGSCGWPVDGEDVQFHEYRLTIKQDVTSPATAAQVEQLVRDQTYREGQLRAAETLLLDTPPIIRQQVPEGVHVLPWMAAEEVGRHLGYGLAGDLPESRDLRQLQLRTHACKAADELELAEQLNGFRPTDEPTYTVAAPEDCLPVLAKVDVLVVGGGTAGAAAAIAAARDGARVLILEYQEALGGIGTVGMIGQPYHGLNIGFAKEVPFPNAQQNIEAKMEWLRRQVRDHGGMIWLDSLAYGALKNDQTVCGVAAATPHGHGAILADVVIDATGNADVAEAAGAEIRFGADEHEIATQGVGLSIRQLGQDHQNSDYLLVDDSDLIDVTRAAVGARMALDPDDCYDTVPLVQSRERQRVCGDFVLSYLDQLLGRTFPDTLVWSKSDYDSHAYPSLPFFALLPHTEGTRKQNHPAPAGSPLTPYRAFLPKGLDGLLVIGLGASMHRDASAMVRMQRDLLNQGCAVGLVATMASRQAVPLRQLDIAPLQQRLVDMGALPAHVLTDTDSFPLTAAQAAAAVADVAAADLDYHDRSVALATLFLMTEAAVPLLQAALTQARADGGDALDERGPILTYAKILGFFGCADGVPDLLTALARAAFDDKIFQGSMAEYAHLPTPVDALVLALAGSGDDRALPAILDKLKDLAADTTLSHHRSVALGLEQLGNSAAAPQIAALLQKPGMSGHVLNGFVPLHNQPAEKRRREGALREIVWARALFHCGDCDGLGRRILEAYAEDWRGHLARHAKAVLKASS